MTRFEQRICASLAGEAAQIPVLLGLCGSGRTTILRQIQRDLGEAACQYINVERTATTPERFLSALVATSPFRVDQAGTRPASPRQAFDGVLAFLSGARCADGSPATFLLDEVMDLRTFENFPGLRRALPEALAVLAATPNRFALASRYVSRAERAIAGAAAPFRVAHMQALGVEDIGVMFADRVEGSDGGEPCPDLAEIVRRLAEGRPAYARALVESLAECSGPARTDAVAAMAGALRVGGRLFVLCGHSYELRLHRARGYGALKAILEILAEVEPLTLTEISHRLGRTPGSTKDYLSWLEDVDLVAVQQKRYRFRDSLLRLFVRLHCTAADPTEDAIAEEARAYASACLGPVGPGAGH